MKQKEIGRNMFDFDPAIKAKLLKGNVVKLKLKEAGRQMMRGIIEFSMQDHPDLIRQMLLKEILHKIDSSPTLKLKEIEIILITEVLKELPQEITIQLKSILSH
jgi:hypothetical protein